MKERREKRKCWVRRGRYAVEVEVDAVYPAGDPSEPCLEPATVRWLDQVARRAEKRGCRLPQVRWRRIFGQFLREQNDNMPYRSQATRCQCQPRGRKELQQFQLSRTFRESSQVITGGGNRTHTGVAAQRILNPQCLPSEWHRRRGGMALGSLK